MAIQQCISEQNLQRTILDCAKLLGWLSYHTYDSRRCSPGFPDLVLCNAVTQELLFVELKSARGRLRPEQRQWIDALRASGAEVWIVRPADMDKLIERLAMKRKERIVS